MLALAGGLDPRLNVRVLAGTSASLAEAVKLTSRPSKLVRLEIGFNTGGLFDSSTTMVNVF